MPTVTFTSLKKTLGKVLNSPTWLISSKKGHFVFKIDPQSYNGPHRPSGLKGLELEKKMDRIQMMDAKKWQ